MLNIDWDAVSRLEEWARTRYLALVEDIGANEFAIESCDSCSLTFLLVINSRKVYVINKTT